VNPELRSNRQRQRLNEVKKNMKLKQVLSIGLFHTIIDIPKDKEKISHI
jgi:hypothetical protein